MKGLFKDKRFYNLVSIALIFLIIVSLVFFTRRVLMGSLEPDYLTDLQGMDSEESGKTHGSGFRVSDFGEKNLFGIAVREPLAKSDNTHSDIEGLKLVGTVTSSHGDGYAFILDPNGSQWVLRRGQNREGVGMLAAVGNDYVELLRGERVRLNLIDIRDVYKEIKGLTEPIRRGAVGRNSGVTWIRKTPAGEYMVDRRQVEEVIENPKNLMTDARLLPVIRDGRQEGFRLREVKKNGIYHSLGLRNNDILLSVNEFPITDPEAALKAFTALRGADEIVLDIKRNGRKKTLKYLIR